LAWTQLLLAGAFEIAWAVGLKYTQGLTRPWPSAATVCAMLLSFWFLARAVRELPLGTAYAIWTGIGVVGTTVLGIILFHESRDAPRLACITLIVAGIVGLKLLSPSTG
jgi:quaternary ammonium compound-resistance protein SugE